MTAHDCIATGCSGPALRAHTSAVAQGFPAIAQPNGHPDPEGVLRAIRGTATLLRTSVASGSESSLTANHQDSKPLGADVHDGHPARRSPRASTRGVRTNPTKTTTPAGKAEVVEERADSPAQRAV